MCLARNQSVYLVPRLKSKPAFERCGKVRTGGMAVLKYGSYPQNSIEQLYINAYNKSLHILGRGGIFYCVKSDRNRIKSLC